MTLTLEVSGSIPCLHPGKKIPKENVLGPIYGKPCICFMCLWNVLYTFEKPYLRLRERGIRISYTKGRNELHSYITMCKDAAAIDDISRIAVYCSVLLNI